MSESNDTPRAAELNQKADVLLLTATEVESKAVLSLVRKTFKRDSERRFTDEKTYYDLGEIGGARVFLVQSEMGAGGLSGATLTVSKGIAELSPLSVVMLGIAFGVDPEKQQIGQILVAKQIVAYRASEGGQRRRRKARHQHPRRPAAGFTKVVRQVSQRGLVLAGGEGRFRAASLGREAHRQQGVQGRLAREGAGSDRR